MDTTPSAATAATAATAAADDRVARLYDALNQLSDDPERPAITTSAQNEQSLHDILNHLDEELKLPITATGAALHYVAGCALSLLAAMLLAIVMCFVLAWLAVLWLNARLLTWNAALLRACVGENAPAQVDISTSEMPEIDVVVDNLPSEQWVREPMSQPLPERHAHVISAEDHSGSATDRANEGQDVVIVPDDHTLEAVTRPQTAFVNMLANRPQRANPFASRGDMALCRELASETTRAKKKKKFVASFQQPPQGKLASKPVHTYAAAARNPTTNNIRTVPSLPEGAIPPHRRRALEIQAKKAAASDNAALADAPFQTTTSVDTIADENASSSSSLRLKMSADDLIALNTGSNVEEELSKRIEFASGVIRDKESTVCPYDICQDLDCTLEHPEQTETQRNIGLNSKSRSAAIEGAVRVVHSQMSPASSNCSWPSRHEGSLIDISPSITKLDPAKTKTDNFAALFSSIVPEADQPARSQHRNGISQPSSMYKFGSHSAKPQSSQSKGTGHNLPQRYGWGAVTLPPPLQSRSFPEVTAIKALQLDPQIQESFLSFGADSEPSRFIPPGLGTAVSERQATFDALLEDGQRGDGHLTTEDGAGLADTYDSAVIAAGQRGHDTPRAAHLTSVHHDLLVGEIQEQSTVIDNLTFNESEPNESLAGPVRGVSASGHKGGPSVSISDGGSSEADATQVEAKDTIAVSRRQAKEKREETRDLLKRDWLARETARKRVVGSNFNPDDMKSLGELTKLYMDRRAELEALMPGGKLNEEDAKVYSVLSHSSLVQPRVRPEGLQNLKFESSKELNIIAEPVSLPVLTEVDDAKSIIDDAKNAMDNARNLRQHALEYFQEPKHRMPIQAWKIAGDKKLGRATKFYNKKRAALIQVFGDAGLPAELDSLYPEAL